MTSETRPQTAEAAPLAPPRTPQPEANAHGVALAVLAPTVPVRLPDNLLPRVLASSLCATNDY